MNNDYSDIRDRIAEPPLWWDEYAVPRYLQFSPREVANIYAHECCLLLIRCQGCGYEFKVAISQNVYNWARPEVKLPTLSERIEQDTLYYGDPPNIGCCPSGATMNSLPVSVVEFWQRGVTPPSRFPDWVRVPELERGLGWKILVPREQQGEGRTS